MRKILSSKVLFGVLALGAAGCSGGSTETTGDVSIRCAGGETFCLISCDLSCTQTGCSVTEIAENQRLRFVFSDRIDTSTVNAASVSIRTPAGFAPAGEYLVSGRELTFVPRVSSSGGVSTFGFLRNESYIITLAGGSDTHGIRSASGGYGLAREFSCTVFASRGIQDEDQLPPAVTLVSPATLTNVPANPTIVLRFSELVDTSGLQAGLSASSPITVTVRGTVNSGGVLVCDDDATGVALEGIPTITTEQVGSTPVTVVTYQPTVALPGSSCITVAVTADLRDLSGRAGVPTEFVLKTAPVAPAPFTVNELFAGSALQDKDQSSGVWASGARAGFIGGDGRHGSFAPTLGTLVAPNTYEINIQNTAIPAANTLDGQPATVTDGRFFFSDFVVPQNITVRFKGTTDPVPPVQIFVRGKVDILGTVDISGEGLPFWTPGTGLPLAGQRVQDFNARGTAVFVLGQPGSAGGPGGGKGGKGGDESNVSGGMPIANTRGVAGSDVRVPAGHAFTGAAVGTGGVGGPVAPSTGTIAIYSTTTSLGPVLTTQYFRGQFSPGGGGGGFALAGAAPTFTAPAAAPKFVAQPAPAGGLQFNLAGGLPGGSTSLNHYLVGGSGGGGGGSHAFGTMSVPTATGSNDHYVAGSGGSGGGGALALRAGGKVTLGPNAVLASRGGAGVFINGDDKASPTSPDANWGVSSPGGGGSGGSFLVQAGGDLVASGLFDTTGGQGSEIKAVKLNVVTDAPFNIVAKAGAGSPGFYRLESPTPVDWNSVQVSVPAFSAAANTGTLV
ncbi:MAG: hypothetical protein JNK78_19125, partial [Planctomycetes bacterium]|nr:hypothetical protein [Planctomycetota bacterium]